VKILLIAFTLIITGCSTIKSSDSLYTVYSKYTAAATNDNNYIKYFNETITSKVSENNASQLLFHQYMVKEKEHFTKINDNIGCLTVNGVNKSGGPIAFYLKYEFINNQWLISDIDVSFLENVELYRNAALCPDESRVE